MATRPRPTLLRPPYGSWDSVDTEDWRYSTADRLIARIRQQLRPGGIVLFHDHGRATLTALDRLLRELDRRDLRAVTVSQLLAQ